MRLKASYGRKEKNEVQENSTYRGFIDTAEECEAFQESHLL